MKLQISFFSQTLYYGLSSVLARLANFLLVPLYITVFPAEDFGVISVFYSVMIFLAIIFSLGMETTFFRFSKKQKGTIFYHCFYFIVIIYNLCINRSNNLASFPKRAHHYFTPYYIYRMVMFDNSY